MKRLCVCIPIALAACSRAPRPAISQPSPPLTAPAPPDAGARPPVVVANWTRLERGWGRPNADRAEPLVLRGVLRPEKPTGVVGGSCEALLGGRQSAAPITLRLGARPRTLFVFVKARGPVGIGAEGDCVASAPDTWARLVLRDVSEDVQLEIADVDLQGHRRGQTSPYVLVVRDEDKPLALEPDAREPAPSDAAIVRWELDPVTCAPGWLGHCYRARVALSGAVKRVVPLARLLHGQLDCFPDGVGVTCGGASGTTTISLLPGNGDVLEVRATSESDGMCPPPNDCSTTETVQQFPFPRGVKLVPDLAGTWPPRR